METNNDLNPALVKYVINKYYNNFMHEHWDDLFSYGLQALYEADAVYNNKHPKITFKYFATCLVRRAMYQFVRDKLSKTFKNTIYTDNNIVLERHKLSNLPSVETLDLRNAIKKLKPKYRHLINYVYFKGYKLVEYATMFKLNPVTIHKKHRRILKKLKDILQYEL